MGRTLRDKNGQFAGSEPNRSATRPPSASTVPASQLAAPPASAATGVSVRDTYRAFERNMRRTNHRSIAHTRDEFLTSLAERHQSSPDQVAEARDLIEEALAEARSSRIYPGSRDYDPGDYIDAVREGLETLGVPKNESWDVAYELVGDDSATWEGPR